MTHLFAVLTLFIASSNALACPRQNENLMVPEYHGQEWMHVGTIDTRTSVVVGNSRYFDLVQATLNGATVCSEKSASSCDNRSQPLKDDALLDDDQVVLVYQ